MDKIADKTIVCYGDSNTYGADMTIPGGRLARRWPTILTRELGDGYIVKEEGQNGRNISTEDSMMNTNLNGLDTLPERLQAHAPVDLLIVMLGTNDVRESYSLSPEQITQNLERLISAAPEIPAWRGDPAILIIAPAPIEPEYAAAGRMSLIMGAGAAEKSKALNALFKDLAQSQGCYFIDAAEFVTVGTVDYVHLSEDGHELLGKAVAAFIKDNKL